LVKDGIERVLDVAEVLSQSEFEAAYPHGTEINRCPEDLETARTWFRVGRVYRVAKSPSPKDIHILKSGDALSGAINSGRATYFYVEPIYNIYVYA
jgi:hypothetical protein